jgi:diguanylate cyclase (GGDEF)-like protein/PAS domain S-box-containing protein
MTKNKVNKYQSLINLLKGTQALSTPLAKKTNEFGSELQELEKELELFTTFSSDTVYRLRYDSMTYEYISPSIIRLLGYTPDEIKHINFRSLILETKIISNKIQQIHSFSELEKARKNGDVTKWQADYLVCKKDGEQIWVTDSSYPWVDQSGQVIGSIGSLRDITDRVNAEEKVKDDLVKLAQTDALTGLYNRRVFFETTDKELKRGLRSESPFSILLIDIDYFKKINDNFGHAVGDKTLQEISSIILACIRQTDTLARIGGEEFGVFLPDTPEDGAYWVAQRICTSVAKHNFFTQEDIMPFKCTVSIGIASNQYNLDITAEDLYKQADTRLYIAKNTGRNQVSNDEIFQMH